MVELAEAIKDLILNYEKACKTEYVDYPLGYALYHTWKKYDELFKPVKRGVEE